MWLAPNAIQRRAIQSALAMRPSERASGVCYAIMSDATARAHAESLADPRAFWARAAQDIDWVRRPRAVWDDSDPLRPAWFPGQPVPYVIGLVELIEQDGLRLTTNIVNCPPERLAIGMPLRVTFEILNDDVALPLFEPEEAA